MAKTKEITIMCDELTVTPNSHHNFQIEIEGFDVENILDHIDDSDLIVYIQSNKQPEEVFSQSELDKWAESEGYIKPTDNE